MSATWSHGSWRKTSSSGDRTQSSGVTASTLPISHFGGPGFLIKKQANKQKKNTIQNKTLQTFGMESFGGQWSVTYEEKPLLNAIPSRRKISPTKMRKDMMTNTRHGQT